MARRQLGYAIRPDLQAIANKRGGLAGSGQTFSRGWCYWHRLNVPAAGQQSFTFFNAGRSAGVTNLEQAGTLPANTIFTIRKIRFSFLAGFDTAGNRLGVSSPTQTQIEASLLNIAKYGTTAVDPVAAANAPALWQEKARELLSHGNAVLSAGERVVYNAFGLTKFPEGRGVVGDVTASAALTNSNTTTVNCLNQVFAGIYNGAPLAGNGFELKGGVTIASGQQFALQVDYVKTVDFTQQYAGPLNGVSGAVTAGVLMCELDGEISTAAQ